METNSLTPTQSPEQPILDKWKKGFGFATLTAFALDEDDPVADLEKRLGDAFLAGSEAQKQATRKEIATYLRNHCGALSSAGVGKLADDIEAAREGATKALLYENKTNSDDALHIDHQCDR